MKPLTPKQKLFLEAYTSRDSNTFGNAYKSAVKAGYPKGYATQIISPSRENQWFSNYCQSEKRLKMLEKAEEVLDESLNYKEKYIKTETARFLARSLGKNRGYSERQEITGKDGENLLFTVTRYDKNNKTQKKEEEKKG